MSKPSSAPEWNDAFDMHRLRDSLIYVAAREAIITRSLSLLAGGRRLEPLCFG